MTSETTKVVGVGTMTIKPPIWHLAISSFAPPRHREEVRAWLRYLPITLVLAYQSAATLRLHNSAFRDEALYIWTGRRVIGSWFSDAVLYDNPVSYFSGSPYIYPPLAAVIDDVGGLTAVRLLSLIFMLSATVAIYSFTSRLFNRRIAFVAAVSFAAAGPTQHLSNFATFDAMALSLIAMATALGVRGAQERRMIYALPVGLLLTLAVATKYASLMFVPAALGVIFLAGPSLRYVAQRLAVTAFAVFGLVLAVVLVTPVGQDSLAGFMSTTTTDRVSLTGASTAEILTEATRYAGAWYVLVLAGLVVAIVRLRRTWLPLLLALFTLAPLLYQIGIHESVSLDKHLDFGLIFGAPLIGVLIMSWPRRMWQKVTALAAVALMLITGVASSRYLFGEWSNSSALSDVLRYKFDGAPYIHTLGEPVEPMRYAFRKSTEFWQFDTTDPVASLYFKTPEGTELRGIEAGKAGLKAGYWQVVYFNGSTGASQQLEPLLKGYGYQMTDTVKLTNNRGPDVYRIWQRF